MKYFCWSIEVIWIVSIACEFNMWNLFTGDELRLEDPFDSTSNQCCRIFQSQKTSFRKGNFHTRSLIESGYLNPSSYFCQLASGIATFYFSFVQFMVMRRLVNETKEMEVSSITWYYSYIGIKDNYWFDVGHRKTKRWRSSISNFSTLLQWYSIIRRQ